jgi:hypothetical protein
MRGDDTLWKSGRQRVPGQEMPTAMTLPDRASIERFVRGTLGCGCPHEVFEHVFIKHLPGVAGRPPIVQLLVGSRLLIHVVRPPVAEAVNGWVEQLASNGRAARDRHGYNRFRLVIASPTPPAAASEIQQCFARAILGDQKAHLHFVAGGQLPAGLEPSASLAD